MKHQECLNFKDRIEMTSPLLILYFYDFAHIRIEFFSDLA